MMKYLQHLYALWGVINFWLWYLLFFPAYFILVQRRAWHKYTYAFNYLWSRMIFYGILIPVLPRWEFRPEKGKRYIYVANHTSYLDIPLISACTPHTTIFIGKAALGKVPLFGYMFNRLHIPVDRKSIKNSFKAFTLAADTLRNGMDVCIFAEGGIRTKKPPMLAPFKDGAFRLAIQEGVEIAPVTIQNNWEIFFNVSFLLKWRPARLIFHKPISVGGKSVDVAKDVMEETWQVIASGLE